MASHTWFPSFYILKLWHQHFISKSGLVSMHTVFWFTRGWTNIWHFLGPFQVTSSVYSCIILITLSQVYTMMTQYCVQTYSNFSNSQFLHSYSYPIWWNWGFSFKNPCFILWTIFAIALEMHVFVAILPLVLQNILWNCLLYSAPFHLLHVTSIQRHNCPIFL